MVSGQRAKLYLRFLPCLELLLTSRQHSTETALFCLEDPEANFSWHCSSVKGWTFGHIFIWLVVKTIKGKEEGIWASFFLSKIILVLSTKSEPQVAGLALSSPVDLWTLKQTREMISRVILLPPMCPAQRHLTSHTESLEVLTLLHDCEPYIHIGVFPMGFWRYQNYSQVFCKL